MPLILLCGRMTPIDLWKQRSFQKHWKGHYFSCALKTGNETFFPSVSFPSLALTRAQLCSIYLSLCHLGYLKENLHPSGVESPEVSKKRRLANYNFWGTMISPKDCGMFYEDDICIETYSNFELVFFNWIFVTFKFSAHFHRYVLSDWPHNPVRFERSQNEPRK